MSLSMFRASVLKRGFSVSATSLKSAALGPLPTFEPTSNPDLDASLSEIRTKLFIPSRMSPSHQALQLRAKNHRLLETEPVEVEVAGEIVPLVPLKHAHTIPTSSYTQAISQIKTPADCDVIPGLIKGFAQAGRKLRVGQLEKTARVIVFNGRTDLIHELVGVAGETSGWKFNLQIAREFMRGAKVHNLAATNKKQALKAVKIVEKLMWAFGRNNKVAVMRSTLQNDPIVNGLALSINTSTAIRFYDGKDHAGQVAAVLKKLQKHWERAEGFLEKDLTEMEPKERAIYAGKNLRDWLPVLEGLFQARDILRGTEHISWIEEKSAVVNDKVVEWKAIVEEAGLKPVGYHSYKRVAEELKARLEEEQVCDETAEEEEEGEGEKKE
ncbi:hypothetical protein BZA77DRAFT_343370 [Pyronema omphalodes]|nr:hypothetical protein BZA77DRAFT_343370 [Pyronema omphalodes]